jgi:hypothetical protein
MQLQFPLLMVCSCRNKTSVSAAKEAVVMHVLKNMSHGNIREV